MNDEKIQDYQLRVSIILKAFRRKYGTESDLVQAHSQTIGTEACKIMQKILKELNIALEINDGVPIGKFMFINRKLKLSAKL